MSVINSTYLGPREVIPVTKLCTAGGSNDRHRIDVVGSHREFNLSVTALAGPYPALCCQLTGILCGAKRTAAAVCGAPAFCNPSEIIGHG
jgi:hypothetical protein